MPGLINFAESRQLFHFVLLYKPNARSPYKILQSPCPKKTPPQGESGTPGAGPLLSTPNFPHKQKTSHKNLDISLLTPYNSHRITKTNQPVILKQATERTERNEE